MNEVNENACSNYEQGKTVPSESNLKDQILREVFQSEQEIISEIIGKVESGEAEEKQTKKSKKWPRSNAEKIEKE